MPISNAMAGLHTHDPGHDSAGDTTAESADICSLLWGRIILIMKCDDIASHPYIPRNVRSQASSHWMLS